MPWTANLKYFLVWCIHWHMEICVCMCVCVSIRNLYFQRQLFRALSSTTGPITSPAPCWDTENSWSRSRSESAGRAHGKMLLSSAVRTSSSAAREQILDWNLFQKSVGESDWSLCPCSIVRWTLAEATCLFGWRGMLLWTVFFYHLYLLPQPSVWIRQ